MGRAQESGFCDRFVRPYGLQCREYQITTSDGYILSIQRISNTSVTAPPITMPAASTSAVSAATAPLTTTTPTPAPTNAVSAAGAAAVAAAEAAARTMSAATAGLFAPSATTDTTTRTTTPAAAAATTWPAGPATTTTAVAASTAVLELPSLPSLLSGRPMLRPQQQQQLQRQELPTTTTTLPSSQPLSQPFSPNATRPCTKLIFSIHATKHVYANTNVPRTDHMKPLSGASQLVSTLSSSLLPFPLVPPYHCPITRPSGNPCCTDPMEPPAAPTPGWIATSYRNLIHYQQREWDTHGRERQGTGGHGREGEGRVSEIGSAICCTLPFSCHCFSSHSALLTSLLTRGPSPAHISNPHISRFSHSIMAKFPCALPFPLPVPARLSLIALLALIALLREAEAYTEPPIPDGCVAEIAEVDREAMRAVYAALPERMFFWHDDITQFKLFDDSHNVSYCCIAPKPANVSCRLWCPLECTPAGHITGIFSDPSRHDMPGPGGSGGSCPPGTLSPAIGDLAELSSLVFRHSCLAGDLPESVTRLQKLTEIEMPENNFTGPIPPGLFRLPALRHVDLNTISLHSYFQHEGLSGSLPDGPDAYSPSLETLNEVRLDSNAPIVPFCEALLSASELWLGFNDLGGASAGSSASATGGGGGGGGGGGEANEGASLHGCVLPAKLERLSVPHAGLRGSVPTDLFLATNAQSGRKPSMGGLGRFIRIDLSHNSLSRNLRAFTVLPSGDLDLSHNNFSGSIPEAFFSDDFWLVDMRFNELSGPLFDARRVWSYDWDVLRMSNNSARMAGAVGAGYLPAPAPGVQASAAETAALLAVRDALLGEAAGGTVGGAGGGTALVNGGNGSWAEILRSWDVSSSSPYCVGCTVDGQVDSLHLLGASNITLHPNFVPESPECVYDQYGR
ncbi:unnamed protein product [Closterium sp. NIES-64]|nr:unnamed protein product [Closterium sp. NIES-64]